MQPGRAQQPVRSLLERWEQRWSLVPVVLLIAALRSSLVHGVSAESQAA